MRSKAEVADHWERQSCGAGAAVSEKYSRSYFDEIESSGTGLSRKSFRSLNSLGMRVNRCWKSALVPVQTFCNGFVQEFTHMAST